MKANTNFSSLPKKFWANVRTISETLGYTERGQGKVRVYSTEDIKNAMTLNKLGYQHLIEVDGRPTELGAKLVEYFEYRAETLNKHVQYQLMDAKEAMELFEKEVSGYESKFPFALNKQKGDKKKIAYLTALVNLLIERNAKNIDYDRDPHRLTTFTSSSEPLRTLSRRVDGCFPDVINPIAVWEIKEYYYTTTFGSRVADGVYETLLDGLELEELRVAENVDVEHLLIVDSHFTWWKSGRSYLCRIIDMLNMGYVDDVIFGKEVVTALPPLVKNWVAKLENRV